jgi:mannonate dehydratase
MNNNCTFDRRKFGKLALTGAIGGSAMHLTTGTASTAGNKWSATGMKLGVSHQTVEKLNDMHFNYLKQMGVEYLEIRMMKPDVSYQEIMDIRKKVEDAGLKIFEVMISAQYRPDDYTLGTPKRDEAITFFRNFIKTLGKAGIDCTTYGWLTTGAAYQTGRTINRGCDTRSFELKKALALPNAYDRTYSDDEMWDNYEYFIKQALPAAEDNGVGYSFTPTTRRSLIRVLRGFSEARKRSNGQWRFPITARIPAFCSVSAAGLKCSARTARARILSRPFMSLAHRGISTRCICGMSAPTCRISVRHSPITAMSTSTKS